MAGADVAERSGAEIVDDRITEEEKGVIRSRGRRGRRDVGVGCDGRRLPRGAVAESYRRDAVPRIGEFAVESERRAGRLVRNRQVGEGRTGPVERNVRRVEVVEGQRAGVIAIAVAIDGECLARITGPPDDLDHMVVVDVDVAERAGAEIVEHLAVVEIGGVIGGRRCPRDVRHDHRRRRRRRRVDVGAIPDRAVVEDDPTDSRACRAGRKLELHGRDVAGIEAGDHKVAVEFLEFNVRRARADFAQRVYLVLPAAKVQYRVAAVAGAPHPGIVEAADAGEQGHAGAGVDRQGAVGEGEIADRSRARRRDVARVQQDLLGAPLGAVGEDDFFDAVAEARGGIAGVVRSAVELRLDGERFTGRFVGDAQIRPAVLDDLEMHVARAEPDEPQRVGLVPRVAPDFRDGVVAVARAPEIDVVARRARKSSRRRRPIERARGRPVRDGRDAAVGFDEKVGIVPGRAVVENDLADHAVAAAHGLILQHDRVLARHREDEVVAERLGAAGDGHGARIDAVDVEGVGDMGVVGKMIAVIFDEGRPVSRGPHVSIGAVEPDEHRRARARRERVATLEAVNDRARALCLFLREQHRFDLLLGPNDAVGELDLLNPRVGPAVAVIELVLDRDLPLGRTVLAVDVDDEVLHVATGHSLDRHFVRGDVGEQQRVDVALVELLVADDAVESVAAVIDVGVVAIAAGKDVVALPCRDGVVAAEAVDLIVAGRARVLIEQHLLHLGARPRRAVVEHDLIERQDGLAGSIDQEPARRRVFGRDQD